LTTSSFPSPIDQTTKLARAQFLFDRAPFEHGAIDGELRALRNSIDFDREPNTASYLEQATAISEARRGHIAVALAHARRSVDFARSDCVEDEVLHHALTTLLLVLNPSDRESELALVLDEASQRIKGTVRGRYLMVHALIEQFRGRLENAERLTHEALAIDPGGALRRASAYNNLAGNLLLQGRLVEAQSWYESAQEIADREGVVVMSAAIDGNLALVALAKGDVVRGLDDFERIQARLRSLHLDSSAGDLDRCRIVLDLGLVDDAVRVGSALLRSPSRGPERADALLAVAAALVLAGDATSASALLAQPGAKGLILLTTRLKHFAALVSRNEVDAPIEPLAIGLPGLVELSLVADALSDSEPSRAASLLRLVPEHPASAGALAHSIDAVVNAALRSDLEGIRKGVATCERIFDDGGLAEMSLGRVWFERIERLSFAVAEAHDDADAALSLVGAGRRIAATIGKWGRTLTREVEPLIRERRALSMTNVGEMTAGARAGRIDDLERRIAVRLAVLPAERGSRNEEQQQPATGDQGATVVYRQAGGEVVALLSVGGTNRFIRLGSIRAVADCVSATNTAAMALLVHDSRRTNVLARRWRTELGRLDAMLVRPLALHPQQALTVLVCAELATVTWGVLPGLRGMEVRLADGLDSQPSPVFDADSPVLLVGGPALDHVGAELDAAASWWHRTERLQDARATAAETLNCFSESSVAHVGAHGQMRGDAPLFSHLRLADGPMTLGDVHRAGRLPKSIVFSACHLGGGAHRRRPTWPTAVALSGRECRSLVVSVLPVSDRSTVAFMSRFHEDLSTGLTPASALARAHAEAFDRGDYGCMGFVEIAINGPGR
jgi:tetratricopeptide (TPR) repeat protein